MINFITTLTAIIGYNSGYFWQLFFTANAVCRYNCNRSKILFCVSLAGICLIQALLQFHIAWSPKFMFASQATICGISFIYNIFKEKWNRNYLFFWIEPSLLIVFMLYFYNRILLIDKLQKLLILYLSLQAIVALWEFLGLKIKIREYEIVFSIVPNSPFHQLLDEIWLRFQLMLAKISGNTVLRKELKREMKNNNFDKKNKHHWKKSNKVLK